MGQYYNPTNISKKQWVYSHDFGVGLKLMEHSYIGNKFVETVEKLLTKGQEWFKDKIVWAGDYADEEKGRKLNLYALIGKDKNKITPKCQFLPKEYKYICNHDKKEYVDKSKIKEDADGFKIHPLPLLTCEGSGRGSGDFNGEDKRIGYWSRDSISIEEKIPEDYKEIDGQFIED